MRLLERSITRVDERMILLAPPRKKVPPVFGKVERSHDKHQQRLHEVQRLRANVYHADGALVDSDLSNSGRYTVPEDDRGWHFLMTNDEGSVTACVRYISHDEVPPASKLQ